MCPKLSSDKEVMKLLNTRRTGRSRSGIEWVAGEIMATQRATNGNVHIVVRRLSSAWA